MKRRSKFFQNIRRVRVNDLLKQLDRNQQKSDRSNQKINTILNERKQKLKQMRQLTDKSFEHSPVKVSASKETFSKESPISSGQKYLLQKYRTNILSPEKANNPQPNMRAGSIDKKKLENYVSENNKEVISKKFNQYIRLLDQQSGAHKKKVLEKMHTKKLPQPLKINMKKTYFKRYPSDRFNFYKPPVSHISRTGSETISTGNKPDYRFSQASQISLSRKYNTIDLSLNEHKSVASLLSRKKARIGSQQSQLIGSQSRVKVKSTLREQGNKFLDRQS